MAGHDGQRVLQLAVGFGREFGIDELFCTKEEQRRLGGCVAGRPERGLAVRLDIHEVPVAVEGVQQAQESDRVDGRVLGDAGGCLPAGG